LVALIFPSLLVIIADALKLLDCKSGYVRVDGSGTGVVGLSIKPERVHATAALTQAASQEVGIRIQNLFALPASRPAFICQSRVYLNLAKQQSFNSNTRASTGTLS
jgi:hypothetical protein